MVPPSALETCRQNTSFDVARLAAMLEPEDRQQTKADVLKIMMRETAFDKSKKPYLSRPQALAWGIAATRRLVQLRREHSWSQEQLSVAMELLGDTTSLTLHELAFRPVIASQGSDEQQAYWSPRAAEYAVFGCYAQTELGHGSNVQKLETTATYNCDTEHFDLHSPTLTSTKWWMGGLGVMASHCIVQAQLVVPVNGEVKHYGPHLFILRIRDEEGHQPVQGVTIGDIGPKAHSAMAGLDNGYIRFSHVKLPRSAMLSRFAQLSADGVYTTPPHAKLSYGGMIYIRAQMIDSLARALARSVTIATRYLHVRRQFSDDSGGQENQVIQYPSVYMRVVPVLVNAYVFMLLGKQMLVDYNAMATGLSKGDTALLAEVHAMSSGLKVYASTAVVEGCETCRRACGGHGFMASAGLAAIYALQLPSTTYEGDNYILNQQVCRAAVKTYAGQVESGHQGATTEHIGDEEGLLLQRRALNMVAELARKKAKTPQWTSLSWDCVAVARAVTEANISKHLTKEIKRLQSQRVRTAEHDAIIRVYKLWQMFTVDLARADLLEYQIVPAPFFESLRGAIETQIRAILPDLIGLTDAFGFSDWELDSTLGGTAGRPYEELLERAERDVHMNLGEKAYISDVRGILEEGRIGFASLQSKL